MQPLPFVDILDTETFLTKYWQKAPCVLRIEFPNETVLDADELAGIAAEQSADSRLVQTPISGSDWRVANGPFKAEDYAILGDSHWTLLVRGVDQYIDGAQALFEYFNFLPSWRREDLMVSFAADQGSVGAHTDFYDVFIVQGEGSRYWRLGDIVASDAKIIPNIDQKVLADFNPTLETTLEQGDVLYIPPLVPHEGISIGQSISYSVGYRAPSLSEAIDQMADLVSEEADPAIRYSDTDIEAVKLHSKIDDASVSRLELLISQAKHNTERVLGELMTQPVIATEPPDEQELSRADIAKILATPEYLIGPAPHTRMAFFQAEENTLIFCNGATYQIPRISDTIAHNICSQSQLEAELQALCYNNQTLLGHVQSWINAGHWGVFDF